MLDNGEALDEGEALEDGLAIGVTSVIGDADGLALGVACGCTAWAP